MAVAQRRPTTVIHHSDQCCQYTSVAFGKRCAEAGVRPSMGSVADAYDNALCESFFATLECKLLDRHRFRTQVEARLAVFDFIEGWFKPRRRHSALDYREEQLGHSTVQVTVDLYGHVRPGLNRGAVDRLAEATRPGAPAMELHSDYTLERR
jgi:transposase InsO family protein